MKGEQQATSPRDRHLADLLEGQEPPNVNDIGLLLPHIMKAHERGVQERLERFVKLLYQANLVR